MKSERVNDAVGLDDVAIRLSVFNSGNIGGGEPCQIGHVRLGTTDALSQKTHKIAEVLFHLFFARHFYGSMFKSIISDINHLRLITSSRVR